MKIAFLSISDPLNKKSWSGNMFYMYKALQSNIHDVDILGPYQPSSLFNKFLRAIAKFTRVVFRRQYMAKYNLLWCWFAAKHFEKMLKNKHYDYIFLPAESSATAFLKTTIPLIYLTDTTFKLISHYYNEFKSIPFLSKIEGNIIEKKVLRKCTSVIFSSVWAADSAVRDYKVSSNKIFITPMGANIDFIPDEKTIYNKMENKQLTLLFLATNWSRKGGDIAFETLKFLTLSSGIKTKLIVCGCKPPAHYKHAGMEVIPYLNKNNKQDAERLSALFSIAHFLLIPTRADCTLTTASEANAFGIPAITTETGGVPEIVKDGLNGYCLPASAKGDTYAALITELFINEDRYKELIRTSRQQYDKCLNWYKWGEGFLEMIEKKETKKLPEPSDKYQNIES